MLSSSRDREKSRAAGRLPRITAAGLCVPMLLLSANAQEARPRFPLTPKQIVSVMQERQLPTRGAQVRLAAPITAAIADPPLEIQAIAPLGRREVRLRVACSDRSQCLPFFAIAAYPEDVDPATLALKPEHGTSGSGPSAPPAHGASARTSSQPDAPVLRSGSAATLGFDGERVHVRIAVICLESGAPGEKIRVTTRDHKQVYIAEVVAPTLLKGTF